MDNVTARVRNGITPVIAIVLLLMMTVAAAGGAYAWLTQLQEQFQKQAEQDVERGIDITDLRCYNEEGAGTVEVFFSNSGTTELDLDPIDLNVRSASTGNVNYTLTRTSISLAAGRLSDQVFFETDGNEDFSDPRSSAAYSIVLDGTMENGQRYEMEFIFTDENSETVTSTCQAEASS